MSLNRIKLFTALVLTASVSFAQEQPAAQQPAAQASPWKDQAEYDLVQKISAAQPAQRIPLLNEWKEKYPDSTFKKQRQETILTTYQQLADMGNAKGAARDLLNLDPNSFAAYYALCTMAFQNQNPTPQDLTESTQSAAGLLTAIEKLEKPQGLNDEQFATLKKDSTVVAHSCAALAPLRNKDYAGAIEHYKKALMVYPDNAAMSLQIGQMYINLKDPKKYPLAFYHYARAVQMTGQRQLNETDKKNQRAYLERQFTRYYDDKPEATKAELDKLYAAAAANPLPPDDFYIESGYDRSKKQFENMEKLKTENPSLFLWVNLRDQLKGENGQKYFDDNVKQALLPPADIGNGMFKAKLVSVEENGKKLLVGIENPNVADVALRFENALPGKAEPGIELEFKGIAAERQADPFMLVLDVEPTDLKGWPTPIKAGPAGAKKPAAKPKGAKPAKAKRG